MAALRRFLLLPRLRLITCVSAASLLILFSRDFRNGMQDERHKRDFNNSSEIPAESAFDSAAINSAAIDLTPLVNTLINSSQSGSRQLFSLLSVSSYSSLDLHKLTLLVYNISSMKSLESGLFRRRFCYCVTNDTNDLTDFTAILLDVMGNSTSFLQELFKSSSILSVSQRNDSDCIYICVMAGKTGRELSGFWGAGAVTPLFNQTIVEGPNRASPHLSRTSLTTLKVTTSTVVTASSSRPPGFTAGRPPTETPIVRTSQSVSTPQIRTAGAAETRSPGTTRRPTSTAASAPPEVTARPHADADADTDAAATAPTASVPPEVTPRPPADADAAATAAAASAPPEVTPRPPADADAAATAAAASVPPEVTPRPPADTDAAATAAAASVLPGVTARPPADTDAAATAAAASVPPEVTPRPPADTDAAATAPTASVPPEVTPQPPADADADTDAAATAPAASVPPEVTPRPPADAATSADAAKAPSPAPPEVIGRPPAAAAATAAAETATTAASAPPEVTPRPPAATSTDAARAPSPAPPEVTPQPPAAAATSLQTTFTRPLTLRPAGRPAETMLSSRDATPDRPRETERPGCPWRKPEPGGEAETLGKLQPCILELCRFFSQCLCRPLSRTTQTKRYCDASFLWYEEHTFQVCRSVKRVSFSRNLKQRCLSKMCNKL